MKKQILFILLLLLGAAGTSAKKIKVTIDGNVYPSQTKLYLIVNEDTANAQLIPIQDAKFSVTLKVEKDAFIRIHDYKEWPKRSAFVLIPDSKHITIDWRTGAITGSEKSTQLRLVMDEIERLAPETFHIDVFSEDKEEWARARETANNIRKKMEMKQLETIMMRIRENSDNNIPAWIYFCYKDMMVGSPEEITGGSNSKWLRHKVMDVMRSRK